MASGPYDGQRSVKWSVRTSSLITPGNRDVSGQPVVFLNEGNGPTSQGFCFIVSNTSPMLEDMLDLHMLTASTGFVTLASFLIAGSVAFLLLTGAIKTQIKWHLA